MLSITWNRCSDVATTKRRSSSSNADAVENVEFLTLEEGRALLDAQARQYLHMSGEEFARRWRAGDIVDPDRPEVIRVSMLLPFAE
jgi:hypothetical protein